MEQEQPKKSARKTDGNIRRGEELLAVLTEILNDNSKVLERLDAIDEKLNRALPPSPGRFTRM